MRIEQAESQEFIRIARELFAEYSESVGVGFCFQGFAQELAQLPGEYARPWGRLFLAFDERRQAGPRLWRTATNRRRDVRDETILCSASVSRKGSGPRVDPCADRRGTRDWLCADEVGYAAFDDHGDCAVPGARISRNCAVLEKSGAERRVF